MARNVNDAKAGEPSSTGSQFVAGHRADWNNDLMGPSSGQCNMSDLCIVPLKEEVCPPLPLLLFPDVWNSDTVVAILELTDESAPLQGRQANKVGGPCTPHDVTE